MKQLLQLLPCLLAIDCCPLPLFAQPAPRLLPFQGRLTDQMGNAANNGVRLVQFKIFEVPNGGSPVWAGELHRTTVNGGLVNVMLGSKTPFAGVDFDRQLYLEITVDINGDNAITTADPPMLPRQTILPVVFAKEAGDSRKLAGHDWTPIFGVNNPSVPIPASKLADGSLPGRKLEPLSVNSNQIALSSISADRIAPRSLSAAQLTPAGITTNELAQAVLDLLVPPGSIIAFGGATVPRGWLLCDGSPLFSTNYPRLFGAVGTAWGGGYTNGVKLGDFNIPDLRGLFLRGVSGPSTNDPDRAGRLSIAPGGNPGNAVGSWQDHQVGSHRHDMEGPATEIGHSINGNGSASLRIDTDDGPPFQGNIWPFRTQFSGGSESRPVNAYVNYIIKY